LEEVGLAVGAVMTLVFAIFSTPSSSVSQRLYMTQQKETFAGNGEIVHDTLLAAAGLLVIWP
jgi:hypothetical protein